MSHIVLIFVAYHANSCNRPSTLSNMFPARDIVWKKKGNRSTNKYNIIYDEISISITSVRKIEPFTVKK